MWLLAKAFPDWATQKAFRTWTNLALLCRQKANMLEKLTLSDYKGSTLSKKQKHKQLIKRGWDDRDRKDVSKARIYLSLHCYPATTDTALDTQPKEKAQWSGSKKQSMLLFVFQHVPALTLQASSKWWWWPTQAGKSLWKWYIKSIMFIPIQMHCKWVSYVFNACNKILT